MDDHDLSEQSESASSVPKGKPFRISREKLPTDFPTHQHEAVFWEALGRTVATFGALEEVLGKAVFAFSGMRRVAEDRAQAEFEKWLTTLERALSDPLGGLISLYDEAIRNYGAGAVPYADDLVAKLREASRYRNVLCHGSWRAPDAAGKSLPLYADKKRGVFETPIDIHFLDATRAHIVDLICSVIESVTQMGWQFPGSTGLGEPIYQR